MVATETLSGSSQHFLGENTHSFKAVENIRFLLEIDYFLSDIDWGCLTEKVVSV